MQKECYDMTKARDKALKLYMQQMSPAMGSMERKARRESFESGYNVGLVVGQNDGIHAGTSVSNNLCLMQAILALHRAFGFGPKRIDEFVKVFDGLWMDFVDVDELQKAVEEECHVVITQERNGLGMDE